MAHLLIIELPGGNDTDLLQAAMESGHSFDFLTQDIGAYQKQPDVHEWVRQATEVICSPSFDDQLIFKDVLTSHEKKPFDALLCLIDIRLIAAAQLAQRLGLRYLNSKSAALLRDKYSVRECLKAHGIAQPEFALATSNDQVLPAIRQIGLPVLMKPSDGYGSQNILTLETQDDLDLAEESLRHLLPMATDYGLGVRSNDRLLIERYMRGHFIGCDTFTLDGQHQLLGVNEKLMFSPPSFAIRGGCFTPNQGQMEGLEQYVFSILDTVGFDHGAAHIEIMLTDEGLRLVEINPRLVGAKIARLVGYSLQQSVHAALIDLHLGRHLLKLSPTTELQPCVTRWLTSAVTGVLQSIDLPSWHDENIQCVEVLSQPGESVSFPFENAQRLGYVMASGKTKEEAEQLADRYIQDAKVVLVAS